MSPRQKEPLTYEHALLGFLAPAPLHAYALHLAVMQSPLGRVWHIKQSACYAMISRLCDEQYIDAGVEDMSARGKRLLSITKLGIQCFETWCVSPVAHPRDMRITFLAKLYFATQQSVARRHQLIAAQQARVHTWYPTVAAPDSFLLDVHAYRIGQIQAIATWLAHLAQT